MKWQIAEDYLEEFVAKVHRTMTPRGGRKPPTYTPTIPSTTSTSPDQQSPLRSRYPPSTSENTPVRGLQGSSPNEYNLLSSPPSLHRSSAPPHPVEAATPERPTTAQRQFMPMSSPAPFYRYSSISTPASGGHERSSPPSSGAIDLAETLVEFSSPMKLREPFSRQISTPSEHEESPSRPQRNGIKTSLGDLQGVDLLRGFEKISSWREGSSPINISEGSRDVDMKSRDHDENGFGKELKSLTREASVSREYEAVNGNDNGIGIGNGIVLGQECIIRSVTPPESQMKDVNVETEGRN